MSKQTDKVSITLYGEKDIVKFFLLIEKKDIAMDIGSCEKSPIQLEINYSKILGFISYDFDYSSNHKLYAIKGTNIYSDVIMSWLKEKILEIITD